MMLVLNERQIVESALKTHSLGDRPFEILRLVARYYHSQGYKKADSVRLMEEFLLKCDPGINIVRWHRAIDAWVKDAEKYPLVEIDGIPITRKELDAIGELKNMTLKKLMFSLLVLSKYGNAVNPKNGGWVNRKCGEIFSRANVSVNRKRQSLLINDLWQMGYIGYSHVIDNVNIYTKIIDNSGEPELVIDDLRNIGNQYLKYIGEPYIACKECGLVFRKESNAARYCKECAASISIQKALERRQVS